VTAENLRNERERIGKLLQVGAVPAHLLAPVIQRIIEVAEDDTEEDLRLRTTLLPSNHDPKKYQTTPRNKDMDEYSGLEDFTNEEESLMILWRGGTPPRDMEALFRINTKIRARNAGFIRSQKRVRKAAEAKATAAAKAPPKAKAALPKPPPRPRVPP